MSYYYHSDQCISLNSINDTVFWANTPTNYTIEVQPFMWPPLLTYKEEVIETNNTSIIFYRLCGPLVVLLRLFAKFINAK